MFATVSQPHLTVSVCQGLAVNGSRTQTKESQYTRTKNHQNQTRQDTTTESKGHQNTKLKRHEACQRTQKKETPEDIRTRGQDNNVQETFKTTRRHQHRTPEDFRHIKQHEETSKDLKQHQTARRREGGESWPL